MVCVGISAKDASKIDEYVCPYHAPSPTATPTSKTPPMEIVESNNKMDGLSVIAQVAHQIISDQEKVPPITPPSNLDLNSLICLADVSEKMDSTPVKDGATSATENESSEKEIQQEEPMEQS